MYPRSRTGELRSHHATSHCPAPPRCASACPFQCRCRSPSPTSHHICSVGSCSCYKNARHICGCPATACNPQRSVKFQSPYLDFSRSRSVSRAGCPSTYIDVTPSVPIKGNDEFSHRHFSPPYAPERKMLEYGNLSSLLRRLSVLQLEMKGLLSGKSLRERVQIIGQKLGDKEDTEMANSKTNPSKDVWLLEDKSAGDWGRKKEENHPAQKYKRTQCDCKTHRSPPGRLETQEQHQQITNGEAKSGEDQCSEAVWKDRKKIVQLWGEYNCDLHLRRIIDSSRRAAACKLLEQLHSRLTFYMLQYIGAVAKGLMGEEKAHYLRFFKREGPFRSKPLSEGTYGELLSFVSNAIKPAKDVMRALEIAEEGLEEEACREGYSPSAIGNIRAQMRAFLAPANNNNNKQGICHSQSCLVSVQEDDLTRDFLHDLSHAADHGKLSTLQPAHKLVKLACFLALKRLDSPKPELSARAARAAAY